MKPDGLCNVGEEKRHETDRPKGLMPPENSFISKGGGDPSGFSVVTDSLSKARNEHFERELSRMKLPSIALGSPEGSQSGDADGEGEGILEILLIRVLKLP